jgi:hypothetical protein
VSNYQIPFDKDGNQQDYPNGWYVGVYPNHKPGGPHWFENFEFTDTLTYSTYGRGRSAVGFEFIRSDSTTVNMFVSDFHLVIPHMVNGKITGRFTFIKKGMNYGCKLLEAA